MQQSAGDSPSTHPAEPVVVGQVVGGKYRVDRIIGQRGTGLVVAAEHLALRQPVAIKLLRASLTREHVERFFREARAAASIASEHVVRVLDTDRGAGGEPFIVMELLEGLPLDRHLARAGPLPVPIAVGHLLEACEAVAKAHEAGIVHRELKPANLFLARGDDGAARIKVLDFGVCKLQDPGTSAARGWLTGSAALLGSPNYMAPEQWVSAARVDARCDVWALGAILYELLAGRPAFPGGDLAAVCHAVQHDEPAALGYLRPDVPPELLTVISRTLRKAPDARFRSVPVLGLALAPFAPAESRALLDELACLADPSARQVGMATAPTMLGAAPEPAGPTPTELSSGPTLPGVSPTLHDAAPGAECDSAPRATEAATRTGAGPTLASGPPPVLASVPPPRSALASGPPPFASVPPPRSALPSGPPPLPSVPPPRHRTVPLAPLRPGASLPPPRSTVPSLPPGSAIAPGRPPLWPIALGIGMLLSLLLGAGVLAWLLL